MLSELIRRTKWWKLGSLFLFTNPRAPKKTLYFNYCLWQKKNTRNVKKWKSWPELILKRGSFHLFLCTGSFGTSQIACIIIFVLNEKHLLKTLSLWNAFSWNMNVIFLLLPPLPPTYTHRRSCWRFFFRSV